MFIATLQFKAKATLGLLFLFISLALFSQDLKTEYSDSRGKPGLSLLKEDPDKLQLNFSLSEFTLVEESIRSEQAYKVVMNDVLLPNDEGAPDLPVLSKYVAVPRGANVVASIENVRTEMLKGLDIAPAPRIPFDTEVGPLHYERNPEIYSKNALYPEQIVQVSEPMKIRGVDVVLIAVSPFQFNPGTKELIVHRDLQINITFEGGSGQFGEDRLRNRWWDAIIRDAVINQSSISEFEPAIKGSERETGCEYLIIIPDNEEFHAWADSIRLFRTKQGILTNVVTTTDIGGNNTSVIEAYINDAYNNWDIPPVAVLMMADYGNSGNRVTSPFYDNYCISDNIYADVDNDHLPDIIFARMTAQNSNHLETMVTKFLNYERTPPTNPHFYLHPISAMGWQTERWFQICSETVAGYFETVHGKEVMRENAIYDGSPGGGIWSTATNTSTILNVFAESGLGYIPDDPGYLTDWGGNASRVNADINNGAFLLQHRDHGGTTGWGEPDYDNNDINGLTNEDLTFVFSINCLTGKFNISGECFAEKFHRHPYGALGLVAATEVSYSFVNDTYVWGLYDNMWPDFLPNHGTTPDSRDVLPAFGNAAGKYFLQQSSWPYNTGNKEVTYYLFHHHGDAFSTIYYNMPQDLNVVHDGVLLSGLDTYDIQVDEGALICFSVGDQIIGLAEGTGETIEVPILAQEPGILVDVVITKQNYYRYESQIEVIPPEGAYCLYAEHILNDSLGNENGSAEINEEIFIDLEIKNLGTEDAEGVEVVITSADPFISIVDSDEYYGNIAAGEFVNIESAFHVVLGNGIPDQHTIQVDVTATDNQDSTWFSKFYITVNAPNLCAEEIMIDDSESGNDNGILDPGETADIIIQLDNEGHDEMHDIACSLVAYNQFITVNTGEQIIPSLDLLSLAYPTFNVTVSEEAPEAVVAEMHFTAQSSGYTVDKVYYPTIGLFIEDWETGDFEKYEWELNGSQDWFINENSPFEGSYDVKSGNIGHNSSTSFELTYEVMGNNSTISFYKKVSSEASWDFLYFYIDGNEKGKWSGNSFWTQVSYPVSEGLHTFKWEYKKDGNTSHGADCAWIDYIELPAMMTTTVFAGVDDEVCEDMPYQCLGTATNYDTIIWSTNGTGSFDTTHILTPVYTPGTEDIAEGNVILTLTIVDDEGTELSDDLMLTISGAPNAPEMPTGPDYVDVFKVSETVYAVDVIANAIEYIWELTPENAGDIVGSDTSATVYWNTDYLGEAEVTISVISECGQSEFSDPLLILVDNTVGLSEVSDEMRFIVKPNPNNGEFSIIIHSHNEHTMNIKLMNYLGKTIYTKENLSVKGQFVQEFSNADMMPGLYILSVEQGGNTYQRKFIVTQ